MKRLEFLKILKIKSFPISVSLVIHLSLAFQLGKSQVGNYIEHLDNYGPSPKSTSLPFLQIQIHKELNGYQFSSMTVEALFREYIKGSRVLVLTIKKVESSFASFDNVHTSTKHL